ncbi:MAG: heparan-alpha-glucosaminide N-acetyltransferase domain-containing protein [Candidatus Acidiferrales bacterium]
MPENRKSRISYIDWLRGFACLGMFEVHCYDSWLGGAARQTRFFRWSQLSGSIPAPLFVLLAGVAVALVTNRLERKGTAARAIATRTILRGAEIFGLGLLLRVQEFVLGWPLAPWTDLLRVDILNLIGLALIAMGIFCWLVRDGIARTVLSAAVALAIALITPLIWTDVRPNILPWFLESYINGVHIYKQPQSWLFPLFPWSGFAFAGLAVGFFLFGDWAVNHAARAVAWLGAMGAGIFCLSYWLDGQAFRLYPEYDYWHTSPNYFLARVGIMLIMFPAAYAWCRWFWGAKGFSPCIQLGQTSLLVYWVHIEFVYGRLSILPKRQQGIPLATLGLCVIVVAMILLSVARTRWKGRGGELWGRIRGSFQRNAHAASES